MEPDKLNRWLTLGANIGVLRHTYSTEFSAELEGLFDDKLCETTQSTR